MDTYESFANRYDFLNSDAPLPPLTIEWQIASPQDFKRHPIVISMNILKTLGRYNKKLKKKAVKHIRKDASHQLLHEEVFLTTTKLAPEVTVRQLGSLNELLDATEQGACGVLIDDQGQLFLVPPGNNISKNGENMLHLRAIDATQGELLLPLIPQVLFSSGHAISINQNQPQEQASTEETETRAQAPQESPLADEPLPEMAAPVVLEEVLTVTAEPFPTLPEPQEEPLVTSPAVETENNLPAASETITIAVSGSESVILPDFDDDPSQLFVGLYKSHKGNVALDIVRQYLYEHLLIQLHAGIPPELSLSLAFEQTEALLREKGLDELVACTVCLITTDMAYVANVGDLQMLVCQTDELSIVTQLHNADDKHEIRRIEQNGGSVVGGRIASVKEGIFETIAITRSLGNQSCKPFITAEPFTTSLSRTNTISFLFFAEYDVIELLTLKKIKATIQKAKTAEKALKELIDLLAQKGETGEKNMLLLQFPQKSL